MTTGFASLTAVTVATVVTTGAARRTATLLLLAIAVVYPYSGWASAGSDTTAAARLRKAVD